MSQIARKIKTIDLIIYSLLLILVCLPATADSFFGSSGEFNSNSSSYPGSMAVFSNTETGQVSVYSSWTRNDDGFDEVSIGNWTSGNGYAGSSGGNASCGIGGCAPAVPMCIASGCLTCSRNTYEPCPVTPPNTVLPPYIPPIQPDDTPGIGVSDPTAPSVSLYIQKQGDSGWTVNTTGSASDQVSLRFVTARANYCQSTNTSYFSVADTTGVSGTVTDVQEPTVVGPTGRRTYTIECRNSSGTTVRDSVTHTIVTDPLEFTATPKLIRSKETSTLTWNVNGRTGCTVANKVNGVDSSTISTSVGSRDTVPLLGETTYRLSCPDGSSADATIRVLPVISET